MVTRLLAEKLLKSKKSVLLLGPRQVGKSTLIRSLGPELIIDFSSQGEFLDHSSNPRLLEELVRSQKPKTVFIDEVQRLPEVLNTVQHIIDTSPKKVKFYLTGSSARKLRRGRANLLPGRLFSYQLSGLSLREIGKAWSLQRGLRFGFLPEAYLSSNQEDAQKLLRTYAADYLKEEIQAEALVRNISGFSRFLTVLAAKAGQALDYSKVSRQAKVSRTNLVRYFEILEDTLVAYKCESFTDVESVDTVKHPKFYFFDVGVMNGLLRNFEATDDRKGLLLEHLVINQIINTASALDVDLKVSYFRTRHGAEVDFIVEKAGRLWAVEVKSGTISSEDLSGLRAFRSYRPDVVQCIAVGVSERQREIDGILVGSIDLLMNKLGLA